MYYYNKLVRIQNNLAEIVTGQPSTKIAIKKEFDCQFGKKIATRGHGQFQQVVTMNNCCCVSDCIETTPYPLCLPDP